MVQVAGAPSPQHINAQQLLDAIHVRAPCHLQVLGMAYYPVSLAEFDPGEPHFYLYAQWRHPCR